MNCVSAYREPLSRCRTIEFQIEEGEGEREEISSVTYKAVPKREKSGGTR
jgi:hypothetical protein